MGAYIASNNGQTIQWMDPVPDTLPTGAVNMGGDLPTSAQLAAVFPGYAAAIAEQQAQTTAMAAYNAAIAAGCQIVSTGTPALNGTYALDAQSISDVMSEVQFIGAFSEFSNMASTLVWPVVGGAVTFPSTAAAMSVFKSLAQYVTAWKQFSAGVTTTQPTQPVTIA